MSWCCPCHCCSSSPAIMQNFLYHMWCLTSTFLGQQQEADQQYLEAVCNLRLISLTWNCGISDRTIRTRVKKVLHMLLKLWKFTERNNLSFFKKHQVFSLLCLHYLKDPFPVLVMSLCSSLFYYVHCDTSQRLHKISFSTKRNNKRNW